MREQHFEGHFDTARVEVNYITSLGKLAGAPIIQEFLQGPVPVREEVQTTRFLARKIEEWGGEAHITFNDAKSVPRNERNAPLDGNAPVDDMGELPKVAAPAILGLYDWV